MSKDLSFDDPLYLMDKFVIPPNKQIYLPITTVVFETRKEMMPRIRRITEWHRKFFQFYREIIISDVDPNIPGVVFVNCGTPPPLDKIEMWYSDICVHFLDRLCDTTHMLIWQWDGFIINPNLWRDDFYQWDYIGAPLGGVWKYFATCMKNQWPNWENPFDVPGQEQTVVGNGGFSLRSKEFLRATNSLKREGLTSRVEDLYLCVEKRNELEKMGIKFSPSSNAEKFSIEGGIFDGTFGFHGRNTLHIIKKYLENKHIWSQMEQYGF